MSDEMTLLPCPFCGGNNMAAGYHSPFIVCEDCGAFGPGSADSTHDEAIAAWNTRAAHGTLTAEDAKRINEIIEKHWHDLPAEYDMPEATALPEYSYDWQAIADELNATLGEANDDECYLVYEGKKYPAELNFGFLGMMPITITVGGFRYLVEVPNGE